MSEIVLQQPKPAPPRIARNRVELEKYLTSNKIQSLWPAVEQQKFAYVIKGLPQNSYNPSIIRFRGRLVMAYRFHTTTLKTQIGMAELDERFNVISAEILNLDEEENLSCEDGRLFLWKGELWLSYVLSTWPNFPSSQVKICKLSKPDHWRVSDKDQYWLPDRQTSEKNHLPVVHDDVFHIVYKSHQPENGDQSDLWQVIYSPYEKREMKSPALRWNYGEVRGGTVPLPFNGRLISFFHSSLDSFEPPNQRCYFVGSVIRKAEPPFNMLAISKKPILFGSEVGGNPCFHHKKGVAIPYGAIEFNGDFLISVGVNDSAAMLIKITEKDLNL